MELYMGWLWYVFCIHMQPQSPPLAAFQQWLDSMVEFTNLFMPCAEHSINTSISMCISVIATCWPGWNLIQRTGRAETGWFSAEKPSKATLLFLSSRHQHYIALCPPLVVPLYLGRSLCSDYFPQIDAVITPLQAVEAHASRSCVCSDMSHSSMVLMEVERGASAHSQSQLHGLCVSLSHGHLLWAEAAPRQVVQ